MEITFHPTREHLGEFPPIPAKKFVPQWYKNLPAEMFDVTAENMVKDGGSTPFSVKRCVPVQDFMTVGYVIRSSSDIFLSAKDDENNYIWWKHSSTKESIVAHHPHGQCPIEINGSRKSYFKLKTGYRVQTPPGYSCLFYQSPYFFENRFTLFPGIVDTDTYDAEVLFPGFVNERRADLKIDAGTPLVWVFPFKRDDWKSTISDTLDVYEQSTFRNRAANYINDIYKRFFHSKKTFD
jgi:hypothetical protein